MKDSDILNKLYEASEINSALMKQERIEAKVLTGHRLLTMLEILNWRDIVTSVCRTQKNFKAL